MYRFPNPLHQLIKILKHHLNNNNKREREREGVTTFFKRKGEKIPIGDRAQQYPANPSSQAGQVGPMIRKSCQAFSLPSQFDRTHV